MHSHIPMTVMGMQCGTRATHSRVWPTMSCVRVMLVKAGLNRPHTRCGATCIEENLHKHFPIMVASSIPTAL